jgi:hypothetical protein
MFTVKVGGKKDISNLTCSMMNSHTMFLFIESNILNIRTIPPMCDLKENPNLGGMALII